MWPQGQYLLAAFLPKASISCLRHSIPSICSWAESSGPRGGKVATRAGSDDLLWGITGGAGPRIRVCFSPRGPLASSPVPDPCGENGQWCQCQRMRWEKPSLNVMKLEVQGLVFSPLGFLWAPGFSYPQDPHRQLTSLFVPSSPSYQHPHLWEKLTGPSGKLPCSRLCCSNRGCEDKKL